MNSVATRTTVGIRFGALGIAIALSACTSRAPTERSVAETEFALSPAPVIGPEFSVGKLKFEPAYVEGLDASIAWDGAGTWLAVWEGLGMARVNASGIVLDPSGIHLERAAGRPVVASDGTIWLVVWEEQVGNQFDLFGARVAADGTVLDPEGFGVSGAAGNQVGASIVFDGTSFVVVWAEQEVGVPPSMHGARITPGGTVLDPDGFLIVPNFSYGSNLVRTASGSLVAWVDMSDDEEGDLYATRIDTAGTVLDPDGFPVSTALYGQVTPQVTAIGDETIVVFQSDVDPTMVENYELRAARIDEDGTVLDPDGVRLFDTTLNSIEFELVRDGPNALVLFEDPSYVVKATRIAPDLSVLDAVPIDVPGRPDYRLFAADGASSALVGWQETDTQSGTIVPPVVFGTRIDPNGAVLDDPPIVLSTAPVIREYPAASASETSFLVAWLESHFDAATDDVVAARVALDGTVLDPGGVNVSHSANAGGADVACDGTACLVVWNDWRRGRGDLYGARIGPGGALLDPGGSLLTGATSWVNVHYPHVARGSSGFLVAATDQRDAPFDYDPFALRVSSAGVVLDPQGIRLGDGSYQFPAAVASDGQQWIVLYDDLVAEELRRARVSDTGSLLDDELVVDDRVYTSSIVHDGSSFVVMFREFSYLEVTHAMRGTRIGSNGAMVDVPPFFVTDGGTAQSQPALAATPDGTILVAYEANRGDDSAIKARIIAPCSTQPGGCPGGGDGGQGGQGQGGEGIEVGGATSAGGSSSGRGGTSSAGAANGGASRGGASGSSASGGDTGMGAAGEVTGGRGGTSAGGRGGGGGTRSAGTGGRTAGPAAAKDESGCGCRVPPRSSSLGGWLLVVGGVAACRRRRGPSPGRRSSRQVT